MRVKIETKNNIIDTYIPEEEFMTPSEAISNTVIDLIKQGEVIKEVQLPEGTQLDLYLLFQPHDTTNEGELPYKMAEEVGFNGQLFGNYIDEHCGIVYRAILEDASRVLVRRLKYLSQSLV